MKKVGKVKHVTEFEKLKTSLPLTNLHALDFSNCLRQNRALYFRKKPLSHIKVAEIIIQCFETVDAKCSPQNAEMIKREFEKVHKTYKSMSNACSRKRGESTLADLEKFVNDTFKLPSVPLKRKPPPPVNEPPLKRVNYNTRL